MRKGHLLLGLASAGAAGAISLAIVGQAAAHATPQTLAASRSLPPVTCGLHESPMGYAGVLRTGQAAAVIQALGTRLLAQVSNRADGTTTELARAAWDLPAPASTGYAPRWLPVYPQAREARFRSCDMTLGNRPADQPLVSAAIASFVRAGYFRSAADARSQLQEVLVSDDPVTAGSVIVTFMITGPVYDPPIPAGASAGARPPLHRLDSYTAIVDTADAAVTGVARGGF
jgi:hypothetical protein